MCGGGVGNVLCVCVYVLFKPVMEALQHVMWLHRLCDEDFNDDTDNHMHAIA